jgi:hypothetical protein
LGITVLSSSASAVLATVLAGAPRLPFRGGQHGGGLCPFGFLGGVGHEHRDLVTGERAAQVAHRPSRVISSGWSLPARRSTNSRLPRLEIIELTA